MSLADIRPAIRTRLLGDSSIYAMVDGSGDVPRIFPIKLPQGVKQASIVYSRISSQGDHTMAGPSGLARPRIQIDCWATKADDANSLALLVKERLDGFSGDVVTASATVTLQGIFFDSERDLYDNEAGLHRVSQDYFIWFAER